jgi:hypothetical protein
MTGRNEKGMHESLKIDKCIILGDSIFFLQISTESTKYISKSRSDILRQSLNPANYMQPIMTLLFIKKLIVTCLAKDCK